MIKVLHLFNNGRVRTMDYFGRDIPRLARAILHMERASLAYVWVAEVDTNSMDEAYRLTNSIEQIWSKNKGLLKVNAEVGHRSTSVGDLMVGNDGVVYVVMPLGFEEI